MSGRNSAQSVRKQIQEKNSKGRRESETSAGTDATYGYGSEAEGAYSSGSEGGYTSSGNDEDEINEHVKKTDGNEASLGLRKRLRKLLRKKRKDQHEDKQT